VTDEPPSEKRWETWRSSGLLPGIREQARGLVVVVLQCQIARRAELRAGRARIGACCQQHADDLAYGKVPILPRYEESGQSKQPWSISVGCSAEDAS